jgi:hypothetical protein
MELQKSDRTHLYTLLKLKKLNKDINVKGLDEMINLAEATMPEEDVAYVEKKIAELP